MSTNSVGPSPRPSPDQVSTNIIKTRVELPISPYISLYLPGQVSTNIIKTRVETDAEGRGVSTLGRHPHHNPHPNPNPNPNPNLHTRQAA